jgi:hypothetical protein
MMMMMMYSVIYESMIIWQEQKLMKLEFVYPLWVFEAV